MTSSTNTLETLELDPKKSAYAQGAYPRSVPELEWKEKVGCRLPLMFVRNVNARGRGKTD